MTTPIPMSAWPDLLILVEQARDLSDEQTDVWLRNLHLAEPMAAALRNLLQESRASGTGDPLAGRPTHSNTPAQLAGANRPFSGGGQIGPWRVLRELGQGGTSVVWLAERADGQFERNVALKVPHAGPWHDVLARRLMREHKILAALEHPHIARLYDVGLSAEGTPYLVIEHVDGINLLAYADANRLGVRQRIALFQQALDAVQYAHSKLVLHCDLKPGNILVDAGGEVKLLDFGIAKVMVDNGSNRDATEMTRSAGSHLTPSYASPEQLLGLAQGTASDVYSLGVILYELLCGALPHVKAGVVPGQLEEAILTAEPRLPSRAAPDATMLSARSTSKRALMKTIQGDLDAIVIKALEKSPEQRFASANALSADLDFWLRGEPVTARSVSVRYHFGKFILRHKVGAVLASSATMALLGSIGIAFAQSNAAQQAAERAGAARDFLLQLFEEAAPHRLGGLELTATQLLEQGRQKARERLGSQPQLQAELLAGIGETQFEVGDMDGADAALSEAATVFAGTGDKSGEASARLLHLEVATSERELERLDGLLQALQPVVSTITKERLLHVRWLKLQGEYQYWMRNMDVARKTLSRCIELADIADWRQARIAFEARLWLATVEATDGDLAAAEANLSTAERVGAPVGGFTVAHKEHGLVEARSSVDFTLDRFADLLRWLPGAILRCEKQFGPNSHRCEPLKYTRLVALLRAGAAEQALAHVREFDRALHRSASPSTQFHTAQLLARVNAINGWTDSRLEPTVILERLVLDKADRPLPVALQLKSMITLGEIRLRAGDYEQAEEWLSRAAAKIPLAGPELERAQQRLGLARGLALQAQGAHEKALVSMEFFCGHAHTNVLDSMLSLNCAPSLAAAGNAPRAIELVRNAIPVLTKSLGPNAPNTMRAKDLLKELASPRTGRTLRWDSSRVFLYGRSIQSENPVGAIAPFAGTKSSPLHWHS